MNRVGRMGWLAAVLAIAPAAPRAAGAIDRAALHEWESMPVLEGGRPMPLAAYARLVLLQLSGRGRAPTGENAAVWLGRVLFEGERTEAEAVCLVGHPELADALGLASDRPRFRASFAQLEPAFDRLAALAAAASARAPAERAAFEREALRLASAVELYASLRRGRVPHIVPEGPGPHAQWRAPADLEAAAASDAAAREALDEWRAIGEAWRARDGAAFADRVRRWRDRVIACAAMPRLRTHLAAELWLVRVRPFRLAWIAYLAAALWPAAAGAATRRARTARAAGLALLVAAAALHSGGLAMRAFIMERPPVTNLYSTFIFAAWAAGVAALLGRLRRSMPLGRGGAVVAAILLFVAGRYEAEGDTMARVVAVLDSNLWLTAHVMTIMLGYAGGLLAGAIAHAALWTAARRGIAAAAEQFRAIRGCLAFGLVFTFIGTTLGGVWADLSWGRFWGWDPKENGALLIILWVSAVLHARASGLIRDPTMAAGAVLTVAVVLASWLGVNLLGIGLHAYGSTTGAARAWLMITLFEVVVAVGGFAAVRRRAARDVVARPPSAESAPSGG